MPLRTYIRYENGEYGFETIKYKYIFEKLIEKYQITEDKGLLTLDFISETVKKDIPNLYKKLSH